MEENEYVCVNCMSRVDCLYTEYSKGVIKITDCLKCNKIADKYIEYDPVLIFNELFLQYGTAYRHLLLNNKTFNAYIRLGICFVLADAYNKWINKRSMMKSERIYDLEWSFYECLLQTLCPSLSLVTSVVIVALSSGIRLAVGVIFVKIISEFTS